MLRLNLVVQVYKKSTEVNSEDPSTRRREEVVADIIRGGLKEPAMVNVQAGKDAVRCVSSPSATMPRGCSARREVYSARREEQRGWRLMWAGSTRRRAKLRGGRGGRSILLAVGINEACRLRPRAIYTGVTFKDKFDRDYEREDEDALAYPMAGTSPAAPCERALRLAG